MLLKKLIQIIELCKNICVSGKKGGERGCCTHPPGEQRVLHTSTWKGGGALGEVQGQKTPPRPVSSRICY